MHGKKYCKNGFTLTGPLIVLVIIGILAALILQYKDRVEKAKWTEVVRFLGPLKQACEIYYQKHGYYPHISGNHVYLNGPMANPNNGLSITVPAYPSATKFIYGIGNKDYLGASRVFPGAKFYVFGFMDKDHNGIHGKGDPYISSSDNGYVHSNYGAPQFDTRLNR